MKILHDTHVACNIFTGMNDEGTLPKGCRKPNKTSGGLKIKCLRENTFSQLGEKCCSAVDLSVDHENKTQVRESP